MTAAEVMARLEVAGVLVHLSGTALAYRAPRAALTDEVFALLREHRDALVAHLQERAHRAGQLGDRPIADLVGHLASAGFYIVLRDDVPEVEAAEGADRDAADPVVLDALSDRVGELVAFLKKSSADMADAELAALGFRRNGHGVVMLPADAPEFKGGWSPPSTDHSRGSTEAGR